MFKILKAIIAAPLEKMITILGFLSFLASFVDYNKATGLSATRDPRLLMFIPGLLIMILGILIYLSRSRVPKSKQEPPLPCDVPTKVKECIKQLEPKIEDKIYWDLYPKNAGMPLEWDYKEHQNFANDLHAPPVSYYIVSADMLEEWDWWERNGAGFLKSQKSVLEEKGVNRRGVRIFSWHEDIDRKPMIILYSVMHTQLQLKKRGISIETVLVNRDDFKRKLSEEVVTGKVRKQHKQRGEQLTMIGLYKKQHDFYRLILFYPDYKGLIVPFLPEYKNEFNQIQLVLERITSGRDIIFHGKDSEAIEFVSEKLIERNLMLEAQKTYQEFWEKLVSPISSAR